MAEGHELYLLNRGQQSKNPPGSRSLIADANDLKAARAALRNLEFDVVVDWIGFSPDHVERDLALFKGRTRQFIFISSASVYQKPPTHYLITEATPLCNPFSDYSRQQNCLRRTPAARVPRGEFPGYHCPAHLHVQPLLSRRRRRFWRLHAGRPFEAGQTHHCPRRRLVIVGDDATPRISGGDSSGLLGNSQAIGHAFHITSDEVLTWNQIYETIADALGVEAKMVHIPSDFIAKMAPQYAGSLLGDKSWSVVFDNTKIKTFVPGFQAVIPFREGIRRTAAWFAADKKRQVVDLATGRQMDEIIKAYTGRIPG